MTGFADKHVIAELLDEAGWGLDELYLAATDEAARGALFRALGLET